MLCEAAHHAARIGHPFNPFFRKLKAKKGYKVAIVAVAHRLARVLWAMLKNETEFDASKYVAQSEAAWNALLDDGAPAMTKPIDLRLSYVTIQ